MLLCPKCRRAMPVRKRLLLILPEGDKFEYVCTRCGSICGDKIEPDLPPPRAAVHVTRDPEVREPVAESVPAVPARRADSVSLSMRIASLLPSATEIVCALGLGDSLVGVSHECDFPPEIVGRPVLTEPKIDPRGRLRRDRRGGAPAGARRAERVPHQDGRAARSCGPI